ncbi:MAG: hypothetical protein HY928_17415 [Elusimicrobia bacterium]|nr:hypothetical protein [Elusimicrobiota bacterium]
MSVTNLLPAVALILSVAASAAAAQGFDAQAIARACISPTVDLELAPLSAEERAVREERGESSDAARADSLLQGRAEVDEKEDGSAAITWKRGKGSKGVADCRRRLEKIFKKFGDRVALEKEGESRLAKEGKKAVEAVPDAVRKAPSDAGLQGRFFDSSKDRDPGAEAPSAAGLASGAVPTPRADPRPRASMPPSFTRPATEPPLPAASGSANLLGAAARAYQGGSVVTRTAGMTIDTDGALSDADPELARMARRDPYRQSGTSMRYANGRSLDPTRVPYVVVPLKSNMAKLGDLVVVEYGGRSVLAVVGDKGPAHRFGEGSMALARQLGINPSGVSGGVSNGVRYTFLGRGVGRVGGTDEMVAALESHQTALLAAR